MSLFGRRGLWRLGLVAGLLVAGCQIRPPSRLGHDVRRSLGEGREAAAGWVLAARSAARVDAATAISLGYLERLRLGLGSPFRLINYALLDPRLTDSTRTRVAWALLARTLDGLAYRIDPGVLARVAPAWEWGGAPGRKHLELIENTIHESRDPHSGELAVRLAYALAAADGSLSPRAPQLAAQVASLVRDREVARKDAIRLLRAAAEQDVDPLALLQDWRRRRLFEVEQPAIEALSTEGEREGTEIALRLAHVIHELSAHGSAGSSSAARPGVASLLSYRAAIRLQAVADSLDMPPQAPVAIAASIFRPELVDQPGLNASLEARLRAFADGAVSEERLAAQYALLGRAADRDGTASLVVLWAAVGLRAYGQEPVWYPGFGGPSNRELLDRYGVTVQFENRVPASWRPFYRRMLDVALTDLRRVLPALDLRGLKVRFGSADPRQKGTLALHDPRARRVLLPPSTAAGTIAHEIAHDLDWQVALRRYRVRGDYATDRARRREDRLSVRLRDLAGGRLQQPGSGEYPDHARRPAEIFARNMDWFVAVALAADGRVDGYLSSVQDDILTGYGTVRPPDISGAAGDALMTILDEVAPIHPPTRAWFMQTYGLGRAFTPYDLVRLVVEDVPPVASVPAAEAAGLAADPLARLAAVKRAMKEGFDAIDAWVCRTPGAAYDPQLEANRRRLVVEAARARARGVALAFASRLAGYEGRQFMERSLDGAVGTVAALDSTAAVLLTQLVDSASVVAPVDTRLEDPFNLSAPPARCARSLFGVSNARNTGAPDRLVQLNLKADR